MALGGHQNRVPRAPRLGAAGGHFEPRRKLVEFLKDIFDRNALFKSRAYDLFERLLNALANHKNEFAEAGAKCVVNRIIDDGFAARTHRINLLQTAIAATHAGSQNEQGRRCCQLHLKESSSSVLFLSINTNTRGGLYGACGPGRGGLSGQCRLDPRLDGGLSRKGCCRNRECRCYARPDG